MNQRHNECSAEHRFRFWRLATSLVFCLAAFPLDIKAQNNQLSYQKSEFRIEMRDGVTLHTTLYRPVAGQANGGNRKFPILLCRTPYGCNPYGEEHADPIMYNRSLVESGYFFVFQDLRSRSMSDGDPRFENLKPVYSLTDSTAVDEATDAYDTIEWLLENLDGHNGRVGLWGHSYTGWTALMGAVSAHPGVKVVIAASPPVDIYFEDFNRYGLFTLAYTPVLDWFGTPKRKRTTGPWWDNQLDYWADGERFGLAKDSYEFYLKIGSLKNLDALVGSDNYFWEFIKRHPDYDKTRQERNSLQYLRGISCPVLIVGGWNDEQNLYGFVNAYQTINANNPAADCRLLVGPWSHGQHRSSEENCYVGNVFFGRSLSAFYQEQVEFRCMEHYLKGQPDPELAEATLFDTGKKCWTIFTDYPPVSRQTRRLHFGKHEKLAWVQQKAANEDIFEFVSDPAKPVPYIEDDSFSLFPAEHSMTADQRFASKRPDVLTFVTAPLEEDVRMLGSLKAKLRFSTDQTDADLIVKLIDVYPMDREPIATDKPGLKMNGYQQLVRFGCIRGRYREGFSLSKPFKSAEVTNVDVDLLDVCHTFQAGHKIMVQVQSSMFPLFDRNPQRYVENIFQASETDFQKATHRLHLGSFIEFHVH